MSSFLFSNYKSQYNRVLRILNKISNPINYNGNQTEYEDDLLSFFQNCWHLKDWVMQEPGINRRKLNKKIYKSTSLRICADLANKSKHLVLDFKQVDADIKSCSVTISVPIITIINDGNSELIHTSESVPVGTTTWDYNITISDGSVHKASEVVKQAVADWEAILKDSKLI